MKYAVVYEKGESGFGAYVPDLPGCVAVGKTLERVQKLIREAIEFHLEGMREEGEEAPRATTVLDYVRVPTRTVAAKRVQKKKMSLR